jgi:hypothetical protein
MKRTEKEIPEVWPRVVPDFFQEDTDAARLLQATWLEKHLGLSDKFFSKLVREKEATFVQWRNNRAHLSCEGKGRLTEFWHVVLHLLAKFNCDQSRVRQLLEQPVESAHPIPLRPKWFGTSIKRYLESGEEDAISEVNHWVTSFRFGDPYSALLQHGNNPSVYNYR